MAYLDGFAGPGLYESGAPGSPALASETADTLSHIRNLEGYYVEKDRQNYEDLCKNLAGAEATIFHGTVEEHLPDILRRVGDAPLFAFFDPFGLGIPFNILAEDVLGRRGESRAQPTTEVLLNFSLPGLRRNAGHLLSQKKNPSYLKARTKLLARLDAVLGGDWWRDVWREDDPDRGHNVFVEYLERLRKAIGSYGSLWVSVSNRWEGPTIYNLILFSGFQGGFWAFNQALSSAMEEYRTHCHEVAGQMDLEPLEVREDRWRSEIAENVQRLIDEDAAPFQVSHRMKEVYGSTLGEAREKHVRAAIKQLYAEGKTGTSGVGSVERMIIEPP